eukprot:3151229-Pyramimonas_sp.AAC.1
MAARLAITFECGCGKLLVKLANMPAPSAASTPPRAASTRDSEVAMRTQCDLGIPGLEEHCNRGCPANRETESCGASVRRGCRQPWIRDSGPPVSPGLSLRPVSEHRANIA